MIRINKGPIALELLHHKLSEVDSLTSFSNDSSIVDDRLEFQQLASGALHYKIAEVLMLSEESTHAFEDSSEGSHAVVCSHLLIALDLVGSLDGVMRKYLARHCDAPRPPPPLPPPHQYSNDDDASQSSSSMLSSPPLSLPSGGDEDSIEAHKKQPHAHRAIQRNERKLNRRWVVY